MYLKIMYLVVLLFMILQFISCNEEDGITNPGTDIITSLEGKIENWAQGDDKNLKLGRPSNITFLEFGNSLIEVDGSFYLKTVHPSESVLSTIIDWFDVDTSMNVQITNYQTKGIEGYLNIFSDSVTEPIGQVKLSNDSLNTGKGYFNVSYFYSEGDLQIIGYKSVEHNVSYFNGTQDTHYNVTFKKGWNKLVYIVLDEIKSGNITTYYKDEWSNNIDDNGKWYYRIY